MAVATKKTHVTFQYLAVVVLFLIACDLTVVLARGFRHQLKLAHRGPYSLSKSSKNSGLFPSTFNVAAKADIYVNATCGEEGPETFCKPSESSRCAVCDSRSPDPGKRHNISNILDSSSSKWWQSPTLARGDHYEYVTILLDLKQVYQVEYVIVKAANSPRPAGWILERSLDGENFQPWQYYAPSDAECWTRYSAPPVAGKPVYIADDEVICTSQYSRQTPMENGEIHTHLVNGRPGALNHSATLQEFTQAKFVRLRLQGLRRNGEVFADKRRAFYSIKEINIGGRCLCSGHAARCRYSVQHGHQECECERHTCGERCEKCCPMYNQIPWKPGTAGKGFHCEKCNCNGHATSCKYDQEVAEKRTSMDIRGKYRGGGVCINCTEHTTGINCEKCEIGYYRPNGVAPDAPEPCLPCDCNTRGSTGYCTPDDSYTRMGKVAGACECNPGYSGYKCDQCAAGYRQFPDCMPCPCDSRGILPSHDCEGDCLCKANVAGEFCDHCKPGYFALTKDNLDGCISCYCFDVADRCTTARLRFSMISTLENWLVTDMNASRAVVPTFDTDNEWLVVAAFDVEYDSPFWLAPQIYTGNRVSSYGSNLVYFVTWVVMRGDTSGKPTTEPNVILVGNNGMRIAYGEEQYNAQEAEIAVPLREQGWFHVRGDIQDIPTRLRRTEFRGDPVTRTQMMRVLADLKYLMIRARYHSEQIEGRLQSAILTVGELSPDGDNDNLVEMCECPEGYMGLSCEKCAWGYAKMPVNGSDHQNRHMCVKCDCNSHAASCDLVMGECGTCEHHTTGPKCDRCAVGYYGIATRGTSEDCIKCACPLSIESNNFSPSCQLDNPVDMNSGYVCTQCPEGYTGDHCETCDVGFYGNPLTPGGTCERCSCNGGACDQETGRCLECRGNTEGWKCERCKEAHFGNPLEQNCMPCNCSPIGSNSTQCDRTTGQCSCGPLFTGRDCSFCIEGYGNVTAGCRECDCDVGANDGFCNSVTGVCSCARGVVGFRCDRCEVDHYGLSADGCKGSTSNIRQTLFEKRCDRHDRCCVEQDSLPSDYGVEMYPGKLIWAWGVLALGAGTLLLSGLQCWFESTIRPEGDGPARSILLDGSRGDNSLVSKRSVKEGLNYASTDEIILEQREIGGDGPWRKSTRLEPRDGGSTIAETSAETNVIYEEHRVTPSINVDDRKIDDDRLSRRNLHANEEHGDTSDESSDRDQHSVIIRTDAHLNTGTRASDENKPGRLDERERRRSKKGSDQAMIDVVTSTKLRNDRFEGDTVAETGSRAKSKTEERRESRIDVVARSARAPRSREASINVDNYLRSSTLMPRRIQNSRGAGNHRVPKIGTSTLNSGDRKGILEIGEKKARLGDEYKSSDPHILQITGVMDIKEEIAPAFSRSAINDRDVERPNEAEEISRSTSGKRARILGSLERNTVKGDAWQFAAGMQVDQLLFFRENRERVQSSAMSPAKAIHDRKNWPGERDRGDPARTRRETSRDWSARIPNQPRNFRGRDNSIYREEIFEKTINSYPQNDNDKTNYNDRKTDFSIYKDDRLRDIFSKERQNNNDDNEFRDKNNNERFLNSVIPPDNKRRKETRGEDLKDLMITSNFVWTSQDRGANDRALVLEHRSTFSQDSRKTSHGVSRRKTRSLDRRKDTRGRTGEAEFDAIQKAGRSETADDDRRKRYADYYSAQSVTPMAYVHIQPTYPATPPTSRKCVRCMVLYKPCPSQTRPPPRIVLPSYRYREPATKWRGLKYGCGCNSLGSMSSVCDIVSGQCECKPQVVGRQCNECKSGYWGLASGSGCVPCNCDTMGSYNVSCHSNTGECHCKPGVGGARCDSCLSGYYGFSSNGCQLCDSCVRPGHVCDPDTGRCVCPRLTYGEHCDRCRPGAWDLVPGVGCRPCACTLGATRSQCDQQGQCPCRLGYDGLRCERCAKGYYGYPRCRPCGCNLAGTTHCRDGICECDDKGQCPCKELVIGRQCNQCKEGTFGLTSHNVKGCTECFCFGRSTLCQQAGLSWGQRRLTRPRVLYINDTVNDIIITNFGAMSVLPAVNGGLNVTNGLTVISGTDGDVTLPTNLYYNYPLYWRLPDSFLGDKIVSYGGFLRFKTSTEGGIPLRSNLRYPVVQLQGNNKIVLEYYLHLPVNDNRYEVRFHESLWQLQNRPDYKVSREVLMVALQNLQYILVKASDNAEFTRTILLEASLDAAVLIPTHSPPLATGVEICQCPPEYNGTSCQDPSIGFYRWYKNTTATSTIVIDLVGQARRCQCNGRSEVCDRETGYCLNCKENTVGVHCNVCADSFYGHPEFGGCKPCPCPQVDKRFSNTCVVRADNEPICHCKPGYIGRKCERCAYGYYGSPGLPGGKCVPCNCNLAGSLSDACDGETGQCKCRHGSTGRDCSQCTAYRHVYINNVCTSCNDNCTGILLDTITMLSEELAEGTSNIADGYVPPPWVELSYIDSNVTTYLEELELRNQLQQRMRNLPWHDYKKLEENIETMLRSLNNNAKLADTLKTKSNDLKNNVFTGKIALDNLRKNINNTILQLHQYSNDNRKIEIKKALKTAKTILNYLKSVDIAKRTSEVETFLDDVTKYVAWLNSLYDETEPLTIAQNDAKDFEIKLNDMRTTIENTMETLFSYDNLYNHINETYIEAKNQCAHIETLHDEANKNITKGKNLVDESRGLLVDAENNIQDLPDLRNKLTYWTGKLSMKEELLYRLNYEYDEKYVVPAVQHAKNLSSYADQYVSLFVETRNIAASPLKASQAYKNIVDGLHEAKVTALAAKESIEDVYKRKSLLDDTKEVLHKSVQQKNSAEEHSKLVKNANTILEDQKQAVLVLKDTLNSTGIKDNEINVKLRELQSNSKKLHEDLLDILEDNDKVAKSVKNTQRLIDDYKQGINERLKPKLNELKREGDSKISLASEKLTEALSNIKKADAKLISLSNAAMKRKAVFDKWNDTLSTKLQNLKDKIAEARNTAEGVRVSLRSVEGKECIRSYRPRILQPSSTTSIVITFALPTARKEGSLFYLPSGVNDDFIALEIVDKKVRFLWNVGGGTGILTHPEILESGDINNDRFWYRIEAERTRHTGKLNVHKQSSTSGNYLPVINTTNPEYGRFDVLSTDRVWIGGIPKSQRRPTELIAGNGLPGCVHQVILDGRYIGLWNFITTAPDMACKPCVEGVEDARDDVAYSFNGEGYAVRNRVSSGPYNKYMFGVSISFRTFDENALLFLAINKENQHIMIFLQEGRVVLQVGYGGNISMEMSSMFKYNTGNWTKVDAFRQYQVRKNIEKCILSIDGNNDRRLVAPTPQPKKEDIPDLSQAKYYIGGLPPSFRAEKLILPSQVSFLGCMANIIVQEGYDPMAEQYYGVEPSCGNKPLKIVGFYGDGYLEHSSFTLRKIQSVLSFSFRTTQDAAMLLLSTFEGHEDRINDNFKKPANKSSYYSVCIFNGQVQVRLNSGHGELILQSNNTFNDGRYHSVTIIKKRKEVELRIDDAYQISGKLRSGIAIKAPDSGGLFFGGLPALINNTKMVATNTPLYGAIQDVIFNDINLRFDEAVNFDHALIGRPGPNMRKDTPNYTPSASLSRGMSTQPEGCQKVPYYSLEMGALKFGDKPHSHTQLYLNFKKFWDKKYTIEFDFRTYYPNGLLFITPGLRLKHYLMVLIRDGQLLLVVRSKQKKEIVFKTPFNDGNWHHVIITHEERKLTLLVDSQTPRFLKIPKKIGLASMMYIGGLPESGTPIPEQVVVRLETLKGCIRSLKINGTVYDMVGSTSRAFNVGQCFPSVESGAYFQGEAYAVYRNNFEVDGVLELQLEFRTSEVSGVLLSITAPSGSPSLSLELNGGKVIMSGDLGDNNPLHVEQGFASHYAICDNQWHRIQAVYNDEELALKVDELDQKYGLPSNVNYHLNSSTFSGPLYIGGIPATAQMGSLLTRDHFNGCIRNVMIRGERRDWTDMAELHNIHLSSCPVQ